MSRSFTREEFHALVWSRPMTHLANEFAVSDVALHKICRRRGIPTPPAGWGAKKAAGKPVRITPLPSAPEGGDRPIVIAAGELRHEPGSLAAVRERARIRAAAAPAEEDASPHPFVRRTWPRCARRSPGKPAWSRPSPRPV